MCGLQKCMKHLSLPSTFHIFPGTHGNAESYLSWWTWTGVCNSCSKRTSAWQGIFCHNFATSRDRWIPCRFTSCTECYRASAVLKFPMNRALGDESIYYKRCNEDEFKFLVARKGEWCLSPFQCERCWFVNMCGRLPVDGSAQDTRSLALICQVNLDVV